MMTGYLGLSDLTASLQLMQHNARVKAELSETGTMLTTGEKPVGEIARAGDIHRVFAIDRSLGTLERFGQAATTGRQRMDAVQLSLQSIRDVAAKVSLGVLQSVKTDNVAGSYVEARGAVSAMETVVASLNQSIAGQSLFAGAATDRAAVADAAQILADVDAIVTAAPDAATAIANVDFYFNDPAGGFATTIYTGAAVDAPDIRVSDSDVIAMPIRADAQPLRDTMRNLALIAAVGNGAFPASIADQKTLLIDAGTRNLTTSDDLNRLRESTGYEQERLERAVARNEAETHRLQLARTNIATVDPYDTATRFQELELQMEKLYTVTARLSQLTLTNYLR